MVILLSVVFMPEIENYFPPKPGFSANHYIWKSEKQSLHHYSLVSFFPLFTLKIQQKP